MRTIVITIDGFVWRHIVAEDGFVCGHIDAEMVL